jgi:hypothetical protein
MRFLRSLRRNFIEVKSAARVRCTAWAADARTRGEAWVGNARTLCTTWVGNARARCTAWAIAACMLIEKVIASARKFTHELFVLPPERADLFGHEWKFEKWTFLVVLLLFLIPFAIREIPTVVRYVCFALAWFISLFLVFTWPTFMGRVPRKTRLFGALVLTSVDWMGRIPANGTWMERGQSVRDDWGPGSTCI